MDSKLLDWAREEFNKFKADSSYTGETGFDPSMEEPYVSQLMELNKYIITTGSTNQPSNPYFDHMWVDCIIPINWVNDKLINTLSRYDWNYRAVDSDGFTFRSKLSLYTLDNAILHNMLSHWAYDKTQPIPPRSFKPARDIREKYAGSLPEKFRDLVKAHGWVKAKELLTPEDYDELEQVKKFPLNAQLLQTLNINSVSLQEITKICENNNIAFDPTQFVSLYIENYGDPISRDFYLELIEIFKEFI